MAHFPRYPRPSALGRLRGRGYKLVVLLLFVRVLRSFPHFFSHITTVSGCDRELNAHFYTAASRKYHVPDIWHDTTPSHIILTLGRPVLAFTVNLSAKRGAVSSIFIDFGKSRSGIEPMTSGSLERTQISDAPECNVCTGDTRHNIIPIRSYFHHAPWHILYIYIYFNITGVSKAKFKDYFFRMKNWTVQKF